MGRQRVLGRRRPSCPGRGPNQHRARVPRYRKKVQWNLGGLGPDRRIRLVPSRPPGTRSRPGQRGGRSRQELRGPRSPRPHRLVDRRIHRDPRLRRAPMPPRTAQGPGPLPRTRSTRAASPRLEGPSAQLTSTCRPPPLRPPFGRFLPVRPPCRARTSSPVGAGRAICLNRRAQKVGYPASRFRAPWREKLCKWRHRASATRKVGPVASKSRRTGVG